MIDVDRARFEQLVADALDSIPEELGRLMENVAVFVEDWPTPEQLEGRRGTLLGLYQGVDLTRRSPLSYGAVMPDRITIFRGPISSIARSEEQLVQHGHRDGDPRGGAPFRDLGRPARGARLGLSR